MRILLFLLTFLCGTAGMAGKLDSLRAVYHDTQRADTIRMQAFRKLIWTGYLFRDPDSARSLIDSMYRTAMRWDLKASAGDACSMRGITFIITNDQESAIKDLRRAEALFQEVGDAKGVSAVQNNLGNAYWKMGDLSRAIELYTRSLQYAEKQNDSSSMASGEINVGLIYKDLRDTARAQEHWERALRISERINDPNGIALACTNLGTSVRDPNDTAAIVFHRRAAEGFREVGNTMYQGTSLCNIAQEYTRAGRYGDAQRMIDSAIVVLRPMGDEFLIRPKVAQMELYLKEKKFDKIISTGEPLRAMADTAATLKDAMDLYNMLSDAHYGVGSMALAFDRLRRFHQFRDSLLSQENRSGLRRNEYRYAYERQAFADSVAHAAEAVETSLRTEQQLTTERGRRNLALSLGGLLAFVVVGVWQRGRLLRRTNTAILDAQTKLVESERAREAAEVRTRIARDVHDQLGSDLTKLALLSSEAKAMAGEDPGALPGLADDIERVAGEANRSLGDIVWAIDPHHDSLAGLTERVRAHSERMLKWSHIPYTVDCVHDGPDHTLDPATKRDIYLILREALNNAIKYSKARQIRVLLHTSPKHVHMEVKDDGIGLDKRIADGHGLENMRQRAERIGARFAINTDKGTDVSLDLVLAS